MSNTDTKPSVLALKILESALVSDVNNPTCRRLMAAIDTEIRPLVDALGAFVALGNSAHRFQTQSDFDRQEVALEAARQVLASVKGGAR